MAKFNFNRFPAPTPGKPIQFNIYKVVHKAKGRAPEVIPLGSVTARHSADALKQAFKKWPGDLDARQVQAGLTVREASRDAYAKSEGIWIT